MNNAYHFSLKTVAKKPEKEKKLCSKSRIFKSVHIQLIQNIFPNSTSSFNSMIPHIFHSNSK